MSAKLINDINRLTKHGTSITAYAVVLLDENGDVHESHEFRPTRPGDINWQAQLASYVGSYANCIRTGQHARAVVRAKPTKIKGA